MKVYVAGPYSAATEEEIQDNVIAAVGAGIKLADKGHAPLVPHQNLMMENALRSMQRDTYPWRKWLDMDIEWLKCADAMLVIGDSRGVREEILAANTAGVQVYYNIDDVPEVK